MTFDECEIVADAACHLKAIVARMRDPENVREVSYVLGMLATLPLSNEPAETAPAHRLGCEAFSVRAPSDPDAEL